MKSDATGERRLLDLRRAARMGIASQLPLIDEPKLAEHGEGHRVLVKLGEMMHQGLALLSVPLFKLLLTSGFHPLWTRPALQLLTLILIACFDVGESG